jgi:hypothetical protein
MTLPEYKKNTGLLWICILLISCLLILYVVCPPVSASIEIRQGDIAYLGETVDISQAIAWPDFTIVWCSGGYAGCMPPTQTIQITGFMYKYYLDPAVFRIGTYYRWDGHWNRGENMVAFTINPGTRPLNTTTPEISTDVGSVSIPRKEGPYYFTIARGDTPLMNMYMNRTDPAHIWIFAATKDGYDIPLENVDGNYSHMLSYNETFSMGVGEYDGYVQFNGKNGMQDVFINKQDFCLDTPYDDAVVPDVDIELWNLINMRTNFDALTKRIPLFDDVLIPIKFKITEPNVIITDVEQENTILHVSGTTSWSDGVIITFKLDPDNYKLNSDIALHTWTTTAHGELDAPRTFSTAIKLNPDELFIGVHELQSTTEKNHFESTAYYNFRITDVYVMPTPTPQITRKIVGMDWQPISTTATPIPEQTIVPTVIQTPTESKATVVSSTVTVNQTTIPTSLPTAKETIPTIPLSPIVIVISIALQYCIRKRF